MVRGSGFWIPRGSRAMFELLDQLDAHTGLGARGLSITLEGTRANLQSISHRCHPILMAFVWEFTKATNHMPLGCLQDGLITNDLCSVAETALLSTGRTVNCSSSTGSPGAGFRCRRVVGAPPFHSPEAGPSFISRCLGLGFRFRV